MLTPHRLICTTLALLLCIAAPGLAATPDNKAIPVLTGTTLNTYAPTAAEILVSPGPVPKDVAIAKVPPVIDFGILPDQWQPTELWSNWGDSAFADGNFYCSIGNHAAPRGTAEVFRIDPERKTMQKVVDYDQIAGLSDETRYAPGKIHCPLMDGGDGWFYFLGYPGAVPVRGWDYVGERMLRYNIHTGVTQNLGVPFPDNSVACAQIHIPSHTLYALGETFDATPGRVDQFYAYDLVNHRIEFAGGPASMMPRAMIVAPDGRVWYATPKPGTFRKAAGSDPGEPGVGLLIRYDPRYKELTLTDIRVPGDGVLRATSTPTSGGGVYGMSANGHIFSFDTRTERLKELCNVEWVSTGYTGVCKLDPTERYLYLIPGSHGRAGPQGSPIFQLDVKTNKLKVLAFPTGFMAKHLNYDLGGTFGTALNEDGSELFMCYNGRPLDKAEANGDFGQCSVMILHIPKAER